MPVGCYKCREGLSIIAIRGNLYFIDVPLIDVHAKNSLDNPYYWKPYPLLSGLPKSG
jgi:hypothetical protein